MQRGRLDAFTKRAAMRLSYLLFELNCRRRARLNLTETCERARRNLSRSLEAFSKTSLPRPLSLSVSLSSCASR